MADNIMETIKIDLLPILDGISDAVFIDDGDGHFVWCNSACEELYQISLPRRPGNPRGGSGEGWHLRTFRHPQSAGRKPRNNHHPRK